MATLLDLLPQNPIKGPPVPQGVNLTWGDFFNTIKNEIGGLIGTVQPGGSQIILPDIVYLTYKSIASAAVDALASPGTLAQWAALIEARVAAEGQFPQYAVAYANISPPPFLYDYKCLKCRWWGPTNTLPDKTCKVVAGPISPQGWCAVWVPPDTYKPFSWPGELIDGNW